MNISPLSNEFVLGAALLLGALLFLIQLFSISKLKKQLAAVPQVQASTLFEEKLSSLENKLEQSNKKVNHAHEIIDSLVSQSKTIKKSSLVRYNPFRDSGVGGLQSFSTASIDDNGDGVVITNLFSREMTRISAKKIANWQPVDQELSPEEKQSIEETKS